MKFILTIISILFCLLVNAQTEPSESLYRGLNKTETEEFKKLEQEILNTIGFNYEQLSPDRYTGSTNIPNSNNNSNPVNLEIESAQQRVTNIRNRYGMVNNRNFKPVVYSQPATINFQPEYVIKPNGDIHSTNNGIERANPSYQINKDNFGNVVIVKTPW